MFLSSIALLVFPLLMAFAASSDLLTMRISNTLVLAIVVAFFLIAAIIGMPFDQIAGRLGIALAALVIGFAFFSFGWVGGGDAKLAAATILWIELPELLPYLIYAALLGGALTMAIISLRRWPLPAMLAGVRWIDRLHDAKSGVPYGIALAAAAILVYARTDIFQALVA